MALIDRVFERKPAQTTQSAEFGVGTTRIIKHSVNIGGATVDSLLSFNKSESSYSAGSTLDLVVQNVNAALGSVGGIQASPIVQYVDPNQDWFAISQNQIPLSVILYTAVIVDDQPLFQNAEEFSGIIDTIDMDLNAGTYTFKCSSYARVLVNAKVSETTAGTAAIPKTTAEAVKYLVKKYGKGLKTTDTSVDATLKTNIGSIYKQDEVKTFRNVPVWDLLESFAVRDNADVYVKGDTLYYHRKAADSAKDSISLGPGIKPDYTFAYGRNIIQATITHASLFAHDITVTVRSFRPHEQDTFQGSKNSSDRENTATAAALLLDQNAFAAKNAASAAKMAPRKAQEIKRGTVKAPQIGGKENYVYVVPNKSQEDCERIAEKLMEEISRREFAVELTVLGQPDFNPRQRIFLENMPSAVLNQVYAIKTVKTSSGADGGYKTVFTLVNHPVQSQASTLGAAR